MNERVYAQTNDAEQNQAGRVASGGSAPTSIAVRGVPATVAGLAAS